MTSKIPDIAINKEVLARLPLVEYHGEITVVDTIEAAREAMEVLGREAIVGFDTETRPTFTKGRTHTVSLVQISTRERCFLIRLNRLGFFDELKSFMENDGVKKIGLSLKDDFFVLHKISEFEPQGFIDLQSFVRDYGIIDSSLQKIYAVVFGRRISKSQRLSNWEAPDLSPAQQHYAALDAWACLHLYDHLTDGLFDPYSSEYIVPPVVESPEDTAAEVMPETAPVEVKEEAAPETTETPKPKRRRRTKKSEG